KVDWIGQEHFAGEAVGSEGDDLPPPNSEDKLDNPQLFSRRRYDRLFLSIIGTQPFVDLAERLRSSCVYNFSPPAIRGHQPMTAGPILARDGSNLASAIEGLREIEPETVLRIGAYLRTIVPGVTSFRTVEYGDFETVRFRLEGKGGPDPLEFDA